MEFIAGFLSAALIAIISAAASIFFTGRHERGTRLGERRQRIYMMLLDLKQTHFWISSGDQPMPGREIRPEIKDRYWQDALRIADELRAADELPQVPDIVDALFGLRFEHEWQRAEQIGKVIDDLGREVNPRFVEAMRRRDRESMELMQRDTEVWWQRRGKIEPWTQTPKERERARRAAETDENEEPEG